MERKIEKERGCRAREWNFFEESEVECRGKKN